MTTLKQLYEEVDVKRADLVVRVAGIILPTVFSSNWSYDFGRVPTAQFSIPRPCPAYVVPNATVEIFAGYNGLLAQVFKGKVSDPRRSATQVTVDCLGEGWQLDVTYKRTIPVVFVGTANAIVTSLMQASGVADYVVNLPAWNIGSVVPQTLEFRTYGEAVVKVAEVDAQPWYVMPSGQVRVDVRDPLPGPTAWRQYFSGQLTGTVEAQPAGVTNAAARPRILDGEISTLLDEVCNSISVIGANIDTTGPDGETNSDPIETSCDGPSPYISTPPGFKDYPFSNELIDQAAKLATVCARLYGLKTRLVQRAGFTIAGDPELFLGATVEIIDPDYTDTSGRWFLKAYSSQIDDRSFRSNITVLGGGPPAGSSPKMDPFACFTWTNDKLKPGGGDDGVTPGAKFEQVMPAAPANGDDGGGGGPVGGGASVIVTVDGRCSQDFDGSIVSWAWVDDQGNSASGPVHAFTYDPAVVSGVDMTLTVTDNDGRTDAVLKHISVTAADVDPVTGLPIGTTVDDSAAGGGAILTIGCYVAAAAWAMFTPDGGATWTDLSKAGGGVAGDYISVSGQTNPDWSRTAIFGTAAGELMRTTDGCATGSVVYTIPGGPRVEFVWKDVDLLDIWWASTNDGRIYRSADDGVTWSLYQNFGDGLPIYRLATPDAGPYRGWLFAYGGSTAVPSSLVRYDVNKTGAWASLPIGGALLAALGAGGSVQEAASAESNDLGLCFTGGVSPVMWYNPDLFDPAGWLPAVGLGAGAGKALAPGYMGAGDLLAVIASLTTYSASDGVTFVGGANPSNSQINHLFWEPGQYGVYLGAATGGVVKTVDHGEQWGYVRPNAGIGTLWPVGAVGYMLSFEAVPYQQAAGNVYVLAVGGGPVYSLLKLTAGPAWQEVDTARPANFWGLRYFGGGNFLHLVSSGLPEVSSDYGVTWAACTAPAGQIRCLDAQVDASGTRIWGIWKDGAGGYPGPSYGIYYSDDFGLTWTLSLTEVLTDLGQPRPFFSIACHPSDVNRIVAVGRGGLNIAGRTTVDGGANWTSWGGFGSGLPADIQSIDPPGFLQAMVCVWTQAGRILVTTSQVGGYDVVYSDNLGVSWSVATVPASFGDGSVQETRQFLRCGNFGPFFLLFATFAGGTTPIMRSLDQGETWTEVGIPPGLGGSTSRGLAYDLLTDRLWWYAVAGDQVYSLTPSETGGSADWETHLYNYTTLGYTQGVQQSIVFVGDEAI